MSDDYEALAKRLRIHAALWGDEIPSPGWVSFIRDVREAATALRSVVQERDALRKEVGVYRNNQTGMADLIGSLRSRLSLLEKALRNLLDCTNEPTYVHMVNGKDCEGDCHVAARAALPFQTVCAYCNKEGHAAMNCPTLGPLGTQTGKLTE